MVGALALRVLRQRRKQDTEYDSAHPMMVWKPLVLPHGEPLFSGSPTVEIRACFVEMALLGHVCVGRGFRNSLP
jgi:hypothetical protein